MQDAGITFAPIDLGDIATTAAVVLTALTIIVGSIWTFTTFIVTQRSEQKLKRTEYIFQLWQSFHHDPVMVECIAIVEGRHPTHTIDDFCQIVAKSGRLTADELLLYQKIEHFLSFLWTLAYAHETLKSLAIDDLNTFGFWYQCVGQNQQLSSYCTKTGYDLIPQIYPKLP